MMKDSLFKEELNKRVAYAEQVIASYLPHAGAFDGELVEAMNYSLTAGGKRLRPLLIDSFYRLYRGRGKAAEPFMAAMEMIHTYSLVHDDLPVIDNDAVRRGKPTTHVKYGESLAVLAGDGLLHEAFCVATARISDCERPQNCFRALSLLASKSGRLGMLGGQTADVVHTKEEPSDELLRYIYDHKTGSLIAGSMMIGAVLAGASERDLERIEELGNKIGLAFQIEDDILDITGDEKVLGKPIRSDERNEKKTYVTMRGMEASLRDLNDLTEEAIEALQTLSGDERETAFLTELFYRLAKRDN